VAWENAIHKSALIQFLLQKSATKWLLFAQSDSYLIATKRLRMTNSIEKRIELKAPVSRVWRALTDHREFVQFQKIVVSRHIE
jgi:hypothetical protein